MSHDGDRRPDRAESGRPRGASGRTPSSSGRPSSAARSSGRDRNPRDREQSFRARDQNPRGREQSSRGGDDRPRHEGPDLPDDVSAADLHPSARNELKTLSKENAEQVARHLAMAARLIDDDPARAHEHALAATRSAGRIAIVRESLGITAYRTGDFALALRELRTYRRISGRDDQIALMVDSERGIGRPDRALETGRAVDRAALPTSSRVALAIAMSGARLDRGEPELALGELDIPELDPDRAFEWSPALFSARAAVLEDLGRDDEAEFWMRRAEAAAQALGLSDDEDDIIVEDGLSMEPEE